MARESLKRARLLLPAAITLAIVSDVPAQGAADGVAALARGDYQRAVEILKPLAEDWGSTDTAAQFFMAGLYETGRGIPGDPLRACALYQRATSNDGDPFGRQALMLFGKFIERGGEFNLECQMLANVGFDNGFEPVTFDLGAGHFVRWTLAAATVTYNGATKRADGFAFVQPGARFLPLRYTELATGPTRTFARHFIEVFVWQPSGRSGPWGLHWHLFEVVGDQIIGIDTPSQPLVTVDGEAPASRESVDGREHAVVRVDDEGNAEWAVLKGAHPTAQRIESEAERRDAREAALARDAALQKIDWSRRYDVSRQPTMSYVDADGCGHIQVYGWTADRAEAIVVRASAVDLGLSTQPVTFDLARQSANLSVETYVYAAPRRQFDFCSDIVMPNGPESIGPERWRAIAGTITIELSPEGIQARAPHLRRATITLRNVVLRNGSGTTVRVTGPLTMTAIVGWLFG